MMQALRKQTRLATAFLGCLGSATISACALPQQDAKTASALAKLEAEVKSLREAGENSNAGRFQIVNGTPSMTRNIMLLDTHTGQTWIVCGDSKIGSAWCDMPSGFTQSGKTTSP